MTFKRVRVGLLLLWDDLYNDFIKEQTVILEKNPQTKQILSKTTSEFESLLHFFLLTSLKQVATITTESIKDGDITLIENIIEGLQNPFKGLTLKKRVANLKRDLNYLILMSYAFKKPLQTLVTKNTFIKDNKQSKIKRLIVSELNRAHLTTLRTIGEKAGNTHVKWKLSVNHNKRDICDTYAEHGTYPIEDVPGYPHPNCGCSLFLVKKKTFDKETKRKI